MKRAAVWACMAMMAGASAALAQVTIAPPPSSSDASAAAGTTATPATLPATPRPPSATVPTTNANTAATVPSAQSVLENLLSTRPAADTTPLPPPVSPTAAAASAMTVAPNAPKGKLIPEGGYIWNSVGRLIKDEKTGAWMFEFDADKKNMDDPPMAIIPSQGLEMLQNASKDGTKPVKFRISGEVTEYQGRNYLYIKEWGLVHDLNQGIGG